MIAAQHRPGHHAAVAEVAFGDHHPARGLRRGGGCYYSTTLSFRDEHTPLPMEYNPRKVFLQLFGEGDTDAERALISRQTSSILDLIADRTSALQRAARRRRPARCWTTTWTPCARSSGGSRRPSERDLSEHHAARRAGRRAGHFDEQVKMMFDLIALAYQANLTRVASYMMVAEGTARTYNHLGVPDAFHPLSHHANDRERLEKLMQDADLAHGAVREVRRQAGRDARRRRLAAGSFAASCTART